MTGIMRPNRTQMLRQAQQMKHPERNTYNEPFNNNDNQQMSMGNTSSKESRDLPMPVKSNPYEVKSYGVASTPHNFKEDHNDMGMNGNKQITNSSDTSKNQSSSKKKKKKKKKKPKDMMSEDSMSNNNMGLSQFANQIPQANNFNTVANNNPMMNNNFGMNMQHSQFPSQASRTPNKQNNPLQNNRQNDDDPFSGIGFGNVSNAFQAPTFNNKMDLFHVNENNNQSNNFDDPFSEDAFSNMSVKIHPPKRTQNDNSMSARGQNNNSHSQYNFGSQSNTQQNDDFGFDDININFDDLNLNDSGITPINSPPETKQKQSVNTLSQNNMAGKNMNNQGFGNPTPNKMGMGNNNHMNNNLGLQNMGNPNMHSPNRGNNPGGNMLSPNRSNDMNGPGMISPIRPNNMSDSNISTPNRPNNMGGMGSPNRGPNDMGLNNMSPNMGFSNEGNMPSMNPPNSNNQNMFNTAIPQRQNFNMGEEQKTNRSQFSQNNMMSMNNSQMSAEPQVIQRGGPPQSKQADLFHLDFDTAQPQNQNKQLQSFGNMQSNRSNMNASNNPNNFGTAQPMNLNMGGMQGSHSGLSNNMPSQNNNQYQNNMQTSNTMPNANNMIVPADPFFAADSSGGFNAGMANNFNTMVPVKPKKKNPFSKGNRNAELSFQTNSMSGSNNNPPSSAFNDAFSQHSSQMSQQNTMSKPTGSMFTTTTPKPQNPLGLDIFGQSNGAATNTMSKNQNPFGGSKQKPTFSNNLNSGNTGGMMSPPNGPTGGGNDFNDLFS